MPTKLISRLSYLAFDKVGHYNPQLLREWQGRLRGRNLLLTGLLSFMIQGVILLRYLSQLPSETSLRSQYCIAAASGYQCLRDANDQPLVNWPFVWADIFTDLSYVLVWALIVCGVYLLSADLSKEARQGTLNFLRMSPLSGRRILFGKLLGVPVLLYLGIGAMLPLHLAMGMMSGYPLWQLMVFYGLLGAIALCFYAAALWFTLLTKGLQGFGTWLITGISLGLVTLAWNFEYLSMASDWFHFFNPLHVLASRKIQGLGETTIHALNQQDKFREYQKLGWFFLPIGEHISGFAALAFANALILGSWFWAVLERKFQRPMSTALSKRQSYGLTACLSLIILGFNLQRISPSGRWLGSETFWSYSISMLIWSILLMFLLLPAKQSVLDWARYRHQGAKQPNRQHLQTAPYRQRGLVAGLLYHDDSPSVLAYAVNLAIMAGILLLGILGRIASGTELPGGGILLDWLLVAALLMTSSLLIQQIALSNWVHWRWIALGAIAAITIGWPFLLAISGIDYYDSSFEFLWLTTAVPQSAEATGLEILGAIAIYLTLISTLSLWLTRRCQRLGQSEWKDMIDANARRSRQQVS
ncbi:MAG: hypothetical protein AAFO84_03210 [Cyanobacteria bacterium J06598_1]